MTYPRVVNRNGLLGDYVGGRSIHELEAARHAVSPGFLVVADPSEQRLGAIAGDLRRLEQDTRDANHLAMYASISGATIAQVKAIFDHFFEGNR